MSRSEIIFAIRIGLWCCVIAAVARWPGYEKMSGLVPTWFIQTLNWQTGHPLTPLPMTPVSSQVDRAYASHLDKRNVRQVLPLLGYISGLGFSIYIVAGHIAGFVFFALWAHMVRKETGDKAIASVSAFAYALTYAGAHFFDDFLYGDGVAIVFLLAAVVVRRPIWIAILVALGGMTDERAAVASVLVLLYWQARSETSTYRPTREAWAVIAGCATMVLWRITLGFFFALETGTSEVATWEILKFHASWYPRNILGVFGCLVAVSWIAAWSIYSKRGAWILTLVVLAAAFSIAPAIVVYDFRRSVSYGFLVILLGVIIAYRYEPRITRTVIWLAALGNLVLTEPKETVFASLW